MWLEGESCFVNIKNYKKYTVIFIIVIVEDVSQFFWSNIKCFKYLSHMYRMFKGTSHLRGNYSINGLVFMKSFKKDYKNFFINFSGLQEEVKIAILQFFNYFIQQSLSCLK